MDILNNAINELSGEEISGEVAFKLYDTYGFPVDLTADVLKDKKIKVDYRVFKNN